MTAPVVFQARPQGGDPRYYAPDRDVAHNIIRSLQAVLDKVDAGQWPDWIRDFLTAKGVDREALLVAAAYLARAFNTVPARNVHTIDAALAALPPPLPAGPALAVVFMLLGEVYLAMGYRGMKSVTRADGSVPSEITDLLAEFDRLDAAVRQLPE